MSGQLKFDAIANVMFEIICTTMHDITRKRICAFLEKKKKKREKNCIGLQAP